MKRRENYKFTNKKHPVRAVASTILGVLAITAYVMAIIFSYKEQGNAAPQLGISALLGLLYACVGLYLGIASRFEKEKFYLFCYLGIAFNAIAIGIAAVTLYFGISR